MSLESSKKTVRVAAAVIRDGNRLFATQRGWGPHQGGWEFPGGKIEEGETPQQALAREIREELDAEIAVGPLAARVEYEEPGFHLSMDCFFCALQSGQWTLKEHAAARWLTLEQLDEVAWLPADATALPRIKSRLQALISQEKM